MDDAADLQNWQEAFEKHPISTTRAIEKQLRSSVANNRERLRVLVGSNYRELLSTAEQIVTLDGQTKAAESHISEIGQQCKPPVGTKARDSSVSRKKLVAELSMLQRLTESAKSAMAEGNWLQSARLIVISRLLAKSLSDQQIPVKSLPSLREKLTSLRRQLLRHIDTTLASPRSVPSTIVEASCGYCLITSTSLQDILRHILRLRIERLRKSLKQPHFLERHVTSALRYYVAIPKLFDRLNGRAMLDALGGLQKRPILQETAFLTSELIDFTGIKSLIADDIVSFTPYLKRTPFPAQEARDILQELALNASSVVAETLQRLLQNETCVSKVLEIRRLLFSVLLPAYFSVPGVSSMHQTLDNVLSKRIEALYLAHIKELREFACDPFLRPSMEANAKSLWQEDLARMSLKDGASSFLQQVHRRRCGTDAGLARMSRTLRKWIISTIAIQEAVQALSNIRWRDMLEEPDEEQESEAERVVERLTKGDQRLYSSQIQKALIEGFKHVEGSIVESVVRNLEQESDVCLAIEHLRNIRELVAPLRLAFPNETKFSELDGLIPRLHEVIAGEVVSKVCVLGGEDRRDAQMDQIALENLPSPRAFGFLRNLCAVMFDIGGTDIWSPSAVRVLKPAIAERVFDQARKKHYMETEFDEEYLAIALQCSTPSSNGLGDQSKSAREYWARTRLLFGILSD